MGDDTGSPPTWSAVTIDFDELSNEEVVNAQYADQVSFSLPAGQELRVGTGGSFGNSAPNYVCTAQVGGSLNCEEDITLSFLRPARGVRISGVGVDASGVFAQARVFDQDELLGVEEAIGDGDSNAPDVLDLSGYTGVTRVELVDVDDPGGVAWDDLVFELRD